ncbi:MAG: M10 family metallopeptidase C-terminal domain-containing protein [Hyphomicrobiales bacterium]
MIAGDGHGGVADTGFGPTVEVTDVVGGAVGTALVGGHGTLTLNADGSYTYVADHAEPLAVGAVVEDVFTYTASDGTDSDTATLTVSVTGVGTGTLAANHLLGNSDANTLEGLGGDDTLDGAAGSDTLIGGIGKDLLIGGADNDRFQYDSVKDSLKGATKRDIITDFVQGDDIIDLSGIDAKKGKSGNQSFKFIGTHKFHDKKGELHYKYNAADNVTVISGDITGNGKANFEIELTGHHNLIKGDFVL